MAPYADCIAQANTAPEQARARPVAACANLPDAPEVAAVRIHTTANPPERSGGFFHPYDFLRSPIPTSFHTLRAM